MRETIGDTKWLLKVCPSVVRRTVIYCFSIPLVWDKDGEIGVIIGQPDGRITRGVGTRVAGDMGGDGK